MEKKRIVEKLFIFNFLFPVRCIFVPHPLRQVGRNPEQKVLIFRLLFKGHTFNDFIVLFVLRMANKSRIALFHTNHFFFRIAWRGGSKYK